MAFMNNTIVTPCNAISDDVYLSLADFQKVIVGDLNPFFLIGKYFICKYSVIQNLFLSYNFSYQKATYSILVLY